MSARSKGLAIGGPETQQLKLAAGESKAVWWQAIANEPGEIVLVVSAKSPNYSDAVEAKLDVLPLAIPDYSFASGAF